MINFTASERQKYELTYTCNPVILTGGIAGDGGFLSIADILQGGVPFKPADYWAQWSDNAGNTILSYSTAEIPFIDTIAAANAQYRNADRVSFIMSTPHRKAGDVINQLGRMQGLRQQLEQHQSDGGTFMLLTAYKIWNNALLENITAVDLVEVGDSPSKIGFLWNFIVPLIDTDKATNSYNDMMKKINGGVNGADGSNKLVVS